MIKIEQMFEMLCSETHKIYHLDENIKTSVLLKIHGIRNIFSMIHDTHRKILS